MNNQLTVMTQSEMMDMAKMFSESKMFPGVEQLAMAFVKIQAGKEIGISPFAAMSGIHIIQGKATVGAGLMAGCVKGSGKYDYRVISMDEKSCSIDFYQGAQKIGNSTFTIEDAKKAQTKNLDKFPKNMLFARAMSNGVKWYCPDVFTMPVYTPEEMGSEITEDITHEAAQPAANTPVVKAKSKLSAKGVTDAVGRLLAGEPDLKTKLTNAFELTPAQLVSVNAAMDFHIKKAPLYELLNSAGLVDNEFAEAKAAIDQCATDEVAAKLFESLTSKQPA